ncbi:MAG: gephyrin-like molybdotransferase Glp [Pseudomonadota bacterium]
MSTSAIKVEEALIRLLAGALPLSPESIAIEDAQDRILAEDTFAKRTQPPFTASAMDGYAVRSQDVIQPGAKLTIIGEVAAGYTLDKFVGENETVRIFTGAPVPEGADAILIQEDANVLDETTIEANVTVAPNSYLRPAGLDFCDGDLLLSKGQVLDAGALCLAASGNHDFLPVHAKPKIGILATGDELRPPGSELEPGQIIASNSYGVAAIIRSHGGIPVDLGIARDTRDSLQNALKCAIEQNCDGLITLGGASVGEHDLVRKVFIDVGMALDFWKILMRPGKPLMFGQLDGMRILGLPGNPVSSLVCSHLFVAPLVAALGGRKHQMERKSAILSHSVPPNGAREQYARAVVSHRDGDVYVDVFENQDSSIVSLYAKANALVMRPIGATAAKAGETVEYIPIS